MFWKEDEGIWKVWRRKLSDGHEKRRAMVRGPLSKGRGLRKDESGLNVYERFEDG